MVCLATNCRNASSLISRALATRGSWNAAVSGVMSESRPEAEVVTRSMGTGMPGESVDWLVGFPFGSMPTIFEASCSTGIVIALLNTAQSKCCCAVKRSNQDPARLFWARVQFVENALQLFQLLPSLAELALRGQALIVGKVFGCFCDERVQITCR
jgi:hypothetical protein